MNKKITICEQLMKHALSGKISSLRFFLSDIESPTINSENSLRQCKFLSNRSCNRFCVASCDQMLHKSELLEIWMHEGYRVYRVQ